MVHDRRVLGAGHHRGWPADGDRIDAEQFRRLGHAERRGALSLTGAAVTAGGSVTLTATGGDLTVGAGSALTAGSGPVSLSSGSGNWTITGATLTASAGSVVLSAPGAVTVQAGVDANGNALGSTVTASGAGGDVSVLVAAPGTGSILVSGSSLTSRAGTVTVSAPNGAVTLTGATLSAAGAGWPSPRRARSPSRPGPPGRR